MAEAGRLGLAPDGLARHTLPPSKRVLRARATFTPPALHPEPRTMANSRYKNGGPTRGRKRVKRMGMNSGKILALGRQKKPRRGRDYTRL